MNWCVYFTRNRLNSQEKYRVEFIFSSMYNKSYEKDKFGQFLAFRCYPFI